MTNAPDDFAALARQYWGLWGDALQGAVPQTEQVPGTQAFREALNAWTQAAGGGQGGFDSVLGHVRQQSGDWLAQLQQLAAQFAGREHSARDIVQAWRQMLGDNPFQDLLHGMRGPGLEGIAQWNAMAQPWLQGLRGEAASLLGLPAFGFTREHQEHAQALGKAHLRWQMALEAYNKLLTRISQDAYACFESKLAEREEPGRQIGSVRALFDLWVDAAEDAWAKAALSQDYRRVFAELTNAQMQLRGAVQAQAEQAATALGLPGRTELDSAHRKIAELERQLRRMQRDAAPPASTPVQANATPAPAKPAATKIAAVKKKPVAKKAAPEPAAKKSVTARGPVKAAATSKASKRKTPVKPTKPAARKR